MSNKIESIIDNRQINILPFLAHPDEPLDRYAQYLSEGPEPANKTSNPRNLFDDSNSKDRKWLKSARKHLAALE